MGFVHPVKPVNTGLQVSRQFVAGLHEFVQLYAEIFRSIRQLYLFQVACQKGAPKGRDRCIDCIDQLG